MSDTQSKRLITWRVQPLLLGQIDNAAKVAEVSRTRWLEWAVQNALEDAEGGVPDVPKPRGVQQAVERSRVARVPVPSPPASSRPPDVVRGSEVRAAEPNVDRFERTDDYRRAMALFRARQPWQHLMKASKREEES